MGDSENAPPDMSRTGAVNPIGGVDDFTMENIIDKLKVLNYERDFCIPTAFKPIHRAYFTYQTHNPAEQFYVFACLTSWLMDLCGHHWSAPGQYDDSISTSATIISELKRLEIDVRELGPGRLRQGYGDGILYVLNTLCDKALVLRKHSWQNPEFPNDNYKEEEGAAEDEDNIKDEVESDNDDDDDDYATGDARRGDDYGKEQMEVIETQVNAEEWRMELERVAPLLKPSRRADTAKDWRAHVDWINQLNKTIDKTFPDVKSSLEKLAEDATKALEKIQKREQTLTNQFESWVDKYRSQKKEFSQLSQTNQHTQDKVTSLSTELNQINELVDQMKSQITMLEERMSDTKPLLNVKDSMSKIKAEVKQMEVRIGILQHSVLRAKVAEARNMHARREQPAEQHA